VAANETPKKTNLVRLGHYFTPQGDDNGEPFGQCETALVCDVQDSNTGELVTLAIWTSTASPYTRQLIHVSPPVIGEYSFHLSGDCPWKR
jgi:hypothetical protein